MEKVIHALVGLSYVTEELLGMRARLSSRPCLYALLYPFPVLSKHFEGLQESHMLHNRPSSILCLAEAFLLSLSLRPLQSF